MAKIKVGINGFGRIGRTFFRQSWENDEIEVVAINSRGELDQYTHLVKHDSVYGEWDRNVEVDGDNLIVNGSKIRYSQVETPEDCKWDEVDVDLVVESTGVFTKKEDAEKHLAGGAKRVLVTAPAKGDVKTLVYGVNHEEWTQDDKVVSTASCTTNCLVPIVRVLQDSFGIESGFMTTVHSYTNNQNTHDGPHKKDLRRARMAAENIVPTTTGATDATEKVVKEVEGKLQGMAMRVPTEIVSVLDFTAKLSEETTAEEVNKVLKEAADGKLKDVLTCSSEPLVSRDYIANPYASIVDTEFTEVKGDLLKVVSWYDNEWGYVAQLVRLINYLTTK